MDIYFIFDTSGSMDEMGKIHLQRNLARYAIQVPSLAQENCTDFVIRLYQWHQDISDITLQSEQTAAFSTICCVPDIPSDGVTNDITLETLMTGPCSSRVVRTAGTGNRPDEGPANAQRRQLVLKMLAEI